MGHRISALEHWLEYHKTNSKGERLRRLSKGLDFPVRMLLERIWWPAFGHFDHLYPEYEIKDRFGRSRYLDLAFVRGVLRVDIEADGFGPHWKDINRYEFDNHLMRQNLIVLEGFKVLRFSRDLIVEQPQLCRQVIQQLMGKYMSINKETRRVNPYEKEVIRLSVHLGEISPKLVGEHLNMTYKSVKPIINNLMRENVLVAASGTSRITKYRLSEHVDLDCYLS